MVNEKIMLWPDDKFSSTSVADEVFKPYMETFLLEGNDVRDVIIICPGGAYAGRAKHEAEPIAIKFNELGFHCIVLHYRVAPCCWPAPQEDALRAIKIVRSNAQNWHINPDKIAILGFSAGGHLACSTGIIFDELDVMAGDSADSFSARPDAMILCYPVISGVNMPNRGSLLNLLGKECLPQELAEYSWELRVKKSTPPSFIWHTAEDLAVPVENSLNFAAALRSHNIPFELHIFPHGRHGLGLGVDNTIPEIQIWPELCARWLSDLKC
ncbi:MAG: alpha/beta hydrolase [Victivallaceae bacterium]|nr:alpha/beta hydrolase [Victivallaceae bacterium]